MPRRPSPWFAAVALLALAASACTGPADPPAAAASPRDPPEIRVAFVGDLSFDAAAQLVSPASEAIQLAFDEANEGADLPAIPELLPMDTRGDPELATSFATEIANDPTVVAVIVAPFWDEPVAFGDRLDAAGVPTVSLSTAGEALAARGWTRWWRAVPRASDLAGSLTAAVRASAGSRGAVCLAGDDTDHASSLAAELRRSLGRRVAADLTIDAEDAVGGAVGVIGAAGCSTVAWTGFDALASALVAALRSEGLDDVRLVGSDAMKDERFLTDAEAGADGTVATCPCVDLTTSTRIDDLRFVHDFQSATGSSPGVYAVEGWDVASMLLDAIRRGAVDRDAIGDELAGREPYTGLAGSYAFGGDGELERGSVRVIAYRAEGVRWLPVATDPGAVSLPVRTRGYLAVGSCRLGPPFRFQRGGEPAGFEVDLMDRIAARLGLIPVWSELPCDAALRVLEGGRLDAVVAPAGDLPVGMPASRVVLALDAALVVSGDGPPVADPVSRLGPGDVVGIVDDAVARSWASTFLAGRGARLVPLPRARAYGRLERGSLDAVADLEYAAWAAIEDRPGLWVVGEHPTGQVDVVAGAGADAEVLAAIDRALGRLIASGRYGLLFGSYFPGAPIPASVGGSPGEG
ncbi:MAG TPA: transporter substrate-binding domain-containing protein [Actinomycetota bacterium]